VQALARDTDIQASWKLAPPQLNGIEAKRANGASVRRSAMSGTLLTILAILATMLLMVCVVAGWLLTLIGLPGNWFIVLVASLNAWLVPDEWRAHVSWKWIVALLILATIGEVLEFIAGALGTQRVGGSRRAALFAIVGSMFGGFLGMTLGMPIPIVGSLVAALLLGGIGAAAGAVFAEWSQGIDTNQTMRVGWGAFLGRLLGTGAKTLIGSVMVAVIVVALIV
jgi:uncharacterized protein YqgC (DUF456 family)